VKGGDVVGRRRERCECSHVPEERQGVRELCARAAPH
jgi:hypothetical protein